MHNMDSTFHNIPHISKSVTLQCEEKKQGPEATEEICIKKRILSMSLTGISMSAKFVESFHCVMTDLGISVSY